MGGFISIMGQLWALVLDVSQWQGLNNFVTLAGSWVHGYWFGAHKIIILKATEGNGFTDPVYAENARRARAAGFVHIAYHFARPDSSPDDAKREARFVAGVAQANGARCVMLDFETTPLPAQALGVWRKAFLDELFRVWPDAPHGLYTGAYLRGTDGQPIPLAGLDPNSVWLCIANYPLGYAPDPDPRNFTRLPPLAPGFTKLALWQYTSSAHVPGIGGTSVDCNIASAEWVALILNQPQEEPMELTPEQVREISLDVLEVLSSDTPEGADVRGKLAAENLRAISGWSKAEGQPWAQPYTNLDTVLAAIAGIDDGVGDPAALADAILAKLGPEVASDVVDAIAAKLAG